MVAAYSCGVRGGGGCVFLWSEGEWWLRIALGVRGSSGCVFLWSEGEWWLRIPVE